MQERQIARGDGRLLPLGRERVVNLIDHHDLDTAQLGHGVTKREQGVAMLTVGQHEACTRVVQDRAYARQMLRTRRLRRKRRHGNGPRVQAAEEARDVIQSRRHKQQSALAVGPLFPLGETLQRGSHRAGARIEPGTGQRPSVALVAGHGA
ncbi:hypothetical protein THI4931_15980 [Pandoraea sputorum]|nr:hypothetical protein THI4931_15980 [Pandoraea sputorum]